MRYAVTGASGWLGMATLELLHARGELGRVTAYASRERSLRLRDGTTLVARPLDALPADGVGNATLMHFAYHTRERAAHMGDAAYVRENIAISATVLDAVQRGAPGALLLPSSGAVYAPGGRGLATDLGTNPYGTLKHLDELAFAELCRRAGTRLATVRVFNVSGPHMAKPAAFALGSLVLATLAGEALQIRAPHPVRRSFVAIADLVAVALAALTDAGGPPHVTFDTAGAETVELGELAERVRLALDRRDLPIERSFDASLPADDYVGDGNTMAALATRYGIALSSLDDQIRATAEALR